MLRHLTFTAACSLTLLTAHAASVDLSKIATRADLDAAIASASEPALKTALEENSAAILAALELHPHAEAVARTVEGAQGKIVKINTTPESLKKAAGGDLPIFDTLKLVDLAVPYTGPHDARKFDPYDAAFFEHLGHLTSLESLNIIQTKLDDAGLTPLANLANLKTLRFTNNGKLSDTGLAKLAGLHNIETFNFVGTTMQGHVFAQFNGWTHLSHCSFRGSALDDEGLRNVCEKFSNLESLSLAHAKFTDAGAPALAKLTKLKSLELGTPHGTPAMLQSLAGLPLDNLQLGEGFESGADIAAIKGLQPLKHLTLTNCQKTTDDDLKTVGTMHQLESLELGNLPLTEDRLPQLEQFAFLKSFRLVQRPKPYPPELQEKIKALLPKVQLIFQ